MKEKRRGFFSVSGLACMKKASAGRELGSTKARENALLRHSDEDSWRWARGGL